MGSKLQKNAIISGYINSYCLVCECFFDTDDETGDHILNDKHLLKLQEHPYLDKYGDNHVRKVNKGYFCEFCCLLLATAARVTLHIQEKSHYDRKGSMLLRRSSGLPAVIAFDDILISERAWHSLTDDTCAICNEEFDNENIHKTEREHLLKLVQNRVEFGNDNNVYRKTDDDSFQCLTCNLVFALSKINEHFADSEHINLYRKCKEEFKKYSEQTKQQPTDLKKQQPTELNKNEASKKLKTVTNESKEMQKKLQEVKNDCKELVPKSDEPDETTTYATENSLTYKAGNPNAFCRVCETKLPGTLRSMKEHVNGKEHKGRLAKASAQLLEAAKAKQTINKRATKFFIKSIVNVENIFSQDIVLNDMYCLSMHSFLTITRNGTKFRCQACEVNMYEDDVSSHTKITKHEQAIREIPVITSLPSSEFVREIRTGVYHCGYCNLIVPRWDEIDAHLEAKEHKENKDAASFRLQRHMPDIREHRRRQEIDFLRMMYMGNIFH